MTKRDRYPAGVPCWIDSARPQADKAVAFYSALLGWEMTDQMPPGSTETYFEAKVDGGLVAAIGTWDNGLPEVGWTTYIAVEDADAAAERVRAAGGRVVVEPHDVLDAGRMAMCADPEGVTFAVWQANTHIGAEVVNAAGSWNWSNLVTADIDAAKQFYGAVFPWEFDEMEIGGQRSVTIVVPEYGDYLETINPGVRAQHAEGGAPPRFTDTVAWLEPMDKGGPRWHLTFTVADADDVARRTPELGGEVLVEPFDIPWQRIAVIRDPDGATFTAGEFKPPT
ncbi:VOC family protein [Solirubrobacter sp. CPCC 204708]|uniref:VOC family protein n=1 Tax=Solirubrobacter deserti TaxID=2282478 RepID=A0ABT4RU86_9ACTN|nr:VOC family protein [Solirubrobacter deserti]MBE2314489.1 VOC family protein [Solirubrobacter deserti]MDA0142096.1 VOC family protein [Solirubrobacter deserti]